MSQFDIDLGDHELTDAERLLLDTPPKNLSESDRSARRRLQNRLAASQSRSRRRTQLSSLTETTNELETRLNNSEQTVKLLRAQCNELLCLLHRSGNAFALPEENAVTFPLKKAQLYNPIQTPFAPSTVISLSALNLRPELMNGIKFTNETTVPVGSVQIGLGLGNNLNIIQNHNVNDSSNNNCNNEKNNNAVNNNNADATVNNANTTNTPSPKPTTSRRNAKVTNNNVLSAVEEGSIKKKINNNIVNNTINNNTDLTPTPSSTPPFPIKRPLEELSGQIDQISSKDGAIHDIYSKNGPIDDIFCVPVPSHINKRQQLNHKRVPSASSGHNGSVSSGSDSDTPLLGPIGAAAMGTSGLQFQNSQNKAQKAQYVPNGAILALKGSLTAANTPNTSIQLNNMLSTTGNGVGGELSNWSSGASVTSLLKSTMLQQQSSVTSGGFDANIANNCVNSAVSTKNTNNTANLPPKSHTTNGILTFASRSNPATPTSNIVNPFANLQNLQHNNPQNGANLTNLPQQNTTYPLNTISTINTINTIHMNNLNIMTNNINNLSNNNNLINNNHNNSNNNNNLNNINNFTNPTFHLPTTNVASLPSSFGPTNPATQLTAVLHRQKCGGQAMTTMKTVPFLQHSFNPQMTLAQQQQQQKFTQQQKFSTLTTTSNNTLLNTRMMSQPQHVVSTQQQQQSLVGRQ